MKKSGLISALKREPLLHFALLAALLFAAELTFTPGAKENIVIDQATASHLIKQRQDTLMRPLKQDERQDLLTTYIEEEVLYREGTKRGLGKNARQRRDIIRQMHALQLAEAREPTAVELDAFFKEQAAQFTRPALRSLRFAYFKTGSPIPNGLRKRLRAGLDPKKIGEPFGNVKDRINGVSAKELSRGLGSEAASKIFALTNDLWQGPIAARGGTFFVQITARQAEQAFALAEVKPYVVREWQRAQARTATEAKMREMRANYDIRINADLGAIP
jgi:hypothetical protein